MEAVEEKLELELVGVCLWQAIDITTPYVSMLSPEYGISIHEQDCALHILNWYRVHCWR